MITISMTCFLVGAALGQRFKVMALMPTILIVSGLSIAAGVTHGESFWSVFLMAATTATCLQIGYFVGICVRHVLKTGMTPNSSSLTPAKTPSRNLAG
jgi:hypothetical protein